MADRIVKIKLEADAAGAVRGLGAVRDAAAEAKAKMHESARSQRAEWSTVGTGLTAVGVAVTGLGVAALKTGVQYNTLQQTTRAALSTLLGSAQAANAQMDKLDDFARNSPFAKQTFITAQQQMLGFGVAAKDVVPALDAIQNAVAAMGGSNEQIAAISEIMSRIKSESRLSGDALQRLGYYGIDAAAIIGSQMGKTAAEIRDMARKPGGIPVDQIWDPLVTGLQEKFGGAAANVKNTFAGSMDRVKAAWRDFASELARPLVDPNGGGALVDLLNWAADAMRAFEDLPGPVKGTASALTGVAGVAATAAGAFMLGLPRVLEFKDALAALGGVSGMAKSGLTQFAGFLTGPWGLALLAAAAVATVLATENAKLSSQARELAETFDRSTGAISENSQAWAANQLQTEGVLSSAKRLGVSAKDMTDAWLGNEDALGRVNARLDKFRKDADFRLENADWKGWSTDLVALDHALDGSNKVLAEARVRHSELAEATAQTSEATGQTASGFEGLTDAAAATQDAISRLSDEILGFGSAQIDADRAAISLEQKIAALNKIVAEGGGSLDIMSEAGQKTESAMLDLVEAAGKNADAILKSSGSQEEATAVLDRARQVLIEHRMALGRDADEASAWADDRLASSESVTKALEGVTAAAKAIPPQKGADVTTNAEAATGKLKDTKGAQDALKPDVGIRVTADTSAAIGPLQAVGQWLDRIASGAHAAITTSGGSTGAGAAAGGNTKGKSGGRAYGGTIGFAQGGTIPGYANGDTVGIGGGVRKGTVWGVGTAKSDSINVNLSAGEEVIQEPYASLHRPVLKAINRGDFVSGIQAPQQVVIVREIGDVYVQNPVTGAYLLSKMADVADAQIDGFAGEQARAGRTARY